MTIPPSGAAAARLRQRKFRRLAGLEVPPDGLPGSLALTHRRCVCKPTCHCATGAGHPIWSLTFMGARVLAVQDKTSTLVIDFACEGIVAGDEMTPWEEIPIPRLASLPDFDRFDSTPSGQPSGTVVMTRDNIAAVGEGYIAFVDLGSAQDVKPGDVMSVFRHVDELPRRMLGQAVVVETREGSSMVKITKSLREIYIGDKVEIER